MTKRTPSEINKLMSNKLLDIIRFSRYGQHDNIEKTSLELAEILKSGNSSSSTAKNIELFFSNNPVKVTKDTISLLSIFEPGHSLDEVFLDKTLKNEIKDILFEYQNIEKLKEYHTHPRHKIILSGGPGLGKTLAAEAIAKELDKPFFKVNYAKLIDSHLGSTGKNISNVFNFANEGECIIFIDEFEGISAKRNNSNDIAELRRVTNQILLEIDKLNPKCLLITATNEKDMIDDAILRRFDSNLNFNLPNDDVINKLIDFELNAIKTPNFDLKGKYNNEIIEIAKKNKNLSSVVQLCERIRRELALRGEGKIKEIIKIEVEK